MSKLFSLLNPFFDALSSGAVIRSTVAALLRLFAVLSFIGGAVAAIGVIGVSAAAGQGMGVVGGLFFGACWMFSAYVQAGILDYRARTVSDLGATNFTITAIVSVLFRMVGEQLSTFFAIIGVGGCIFVWLTGISPLSSLGSFGSMLPVPSSGGSFAGGLVFAIMMLIFAFIALIVCYGLAELTVVLVDIAQNMHLMRVAVAGGAVATPPGAPGMAAPVTREASICPGCKAPQDTGSDFCGFCGTRFS